MKMDIHHMGLNILVNIYRPKTFTSYLKTYMPLLQSWKNKKEDGVVEEETGEVEIEEKI